MSNHAQNVENRLKNVENHVENHVENKSENRGNTWVEPGTTCPPRTPQVLSPSLKIGLRTVSHTHCWPENRQNIAPSAVHLADVHQQCANPASDRARHSGNRAGMRVSAPSNQIRQPNAQRRTWPERRVDDFPLANRVSVAPPTLNRKGLRHD